MEPGIFIGETDATWPLTPPNYARAGLVYLLRLPLPAPTGTPLHAVSIDNAWGSSPLDEPVFDADEVGAVHLFGSWITPLDYTSESPGQELIISARQADVEIAHVINEAGRAIPFLPVQ